MSYQLEHNKVTEISLKNVKFRSDFLNEYIEVQTTKLVSHRSFEICNSKQGDYDPVHFRIDFRDEKWSAAW